MRRLLTLVLVLLALVAAQPAEAFRPGAAAPSATGTSTIYSFDSGGTAYQNQIGDWTTNGNYVDSTSGNTIQVGNTYYHYGDAAGCGFFWQHTGKVYCGETVYSTTDFSNKGWTYHGLMFDPAPFVGVCGPFGCFRPKMLHNAANNKYILWVGVGNGPYQVFDCGSSPTGGATPTTPGNCTFLHNVNDGGDYGFLIDPTTNIAYLANAGAVHQLNASYTDESAIKGPAVGGGEGYSFFYRQGTYYILYGPLCPMCSSNPTYYQTATSPLGPYSNQVVISATSCGGQNSDITVVNGTSGTTYIYESDRWSPQTGGNNAIAARYREPLTFTGSAINPLTCAQSNTVSGVVLSPSTAKPAGSDQSSWPLGQFRATVTLGNSVVDWGQSVSNILQTFIPRNTGTLTAVQLSLGINETFPGNSFGSPPNAPITVAIVTLDGSGKPLAVLSSVTVQPTGLTYAPVSQMITGLSAALTGGVTYGLELSTTSTNSTDYAVGTAANNPYPAGTYKDSLNQGSSWNTRTGKALLFSTFGP